ncbi:MAG: hypothetical protein HUU11_16715 [Anaerolineales bacterium]|nr:hypothetical protein [Anaerolineales bacterium]
MSHVHHEIQFESQSAYEYSDATASLPASARELFTRQTGQILIELGNVLVNAIPLSDEADRNTGNMLISIGNKLKRK